MHEIMDLIINEMLLNKCIVCITVIKLNRLMFKTLLDDRNSIC